MCEIDHGKVQVVVANKETLKIESVGAVNITLLNGTVKTSTMLTNVQYVPGLCVNLLSVSQMIKTGNRVVFEKENCKIFNKNNQLIGTATLVKDMYRLNCVYDGDVRKKMSMCARNETAMSANVSNDLWHRRLGHICDDNLRKVSAAVDGVRLCKKSKNKYVICVKGKQTRAPFKDVGNRAGNLLDLVHSDICGPLQQRSFAGVRYFLTFVDDCSRKVFVFPLKEKNQTFSTFVQFKALVENQCGRKIKVLRTDNGTEYCNNNFKKLCTEHGILHQTTTPYTPEQNGVAERINRTLIERVRCILIDSGLSKQFWAEALSTATYLINRVPCRNERTITPEELWSNVKPDLTLLRVFGCKAMVHVPKEKRRKLDTKSIECIMLAYSSESKAYCLYNAATKKIMISRDVVFIETGLHENQDVKVIEKRDVKINSSFSPAVVTLDDNVIDDNVNSGGEYDDGESSIVEITADHQIDTSGEPETFVESEAEDPTVEPDDVEVSVSEQRIIDGGVIADDTLDDSNETFVSDYGDDPPYIPDQIVETPTEVRHSERISKLNARPKANLVAEEIIASDPVTVEQALSGPNADMWRNAMNEEMESLRENQTWSLVDLPHGKTPIKCKWVFKTKRNAKGETVRYKARLVVKGFTQQEGIDYHETFSPVVKYTSIRFLLAIAAKFNLNIRQMDAVTAFLQGNLKEDIYMCQPEGSTLFRTKFANCESRYTA